MPIEIDKSHQKMMDSVSNEKNALEKKLEQLQKQEQMFLNLGDMGSEAYKKVQDKITETKKKLEDLNDVLQTSDGMLAQFVKTKEELEKKLETSKMKLDIAKQSGDVSAIKKAQEEYDEQRKSLSLINEEIQKQKDLPSDLQAIVTELDKLRSAKAEIDINMPELKGSLGYKKIEEQIKKAEESLETLETRLLQTASVSGSAFVKTFAEGIDKEFLTLYKKVAGNNAKLMNLFPQSDAKEGPFRNLSKSGSSLVVTFLSGIERAKSKLFSSLLNIMNDAQGFINFQTLGKNYMYDTSLEDQFNIKSLLDLGLPKAEIRCRKENESIKQYVVHTREQIAKVVLDFANYKSKILRKAHEMKLELLEQIIEAFDMTPADDIDYPEIYSRQREFLNTEDAVDQTRRIADATRILRNFPEIDQNSIDITIDEKNKLAIKYKVKN